MFSPDICQQPKMSTQLGKYDCQGFFAFILWCLCFFSICIYYYCTWWCWRKFLHTIFRRALKKPPNELCPALVSLCLFAHLFFFALAQFCKKPCNPVFDVLQFFKKLCTCFCICRRGNWTHDLPCRTRSIDHGHNVKQKRESFMFRIYCRCKVKKGIFFKTLRQNNAVLRRAALSERKQRRTELVRAVCSVPPILDPFHFHLQ